LRRFRRPQSLAELARPQRAAALPAQVRILGLDPGSQRTGYAIVETQAGRIAYIVSGAIRARGESLAERLQEIFVGVESLTGEFRPDEVAIERVFMNRNADSALKPLAVVERRTVVTLPHNVEEFDVSPDGETFVLVAPASPASDVLVAVNWSKALRREWRENSARAP
jgi:hypothetical protein